MHKIRHIFSHAETLIQFYFRLFFTANLWHFEHFCDCLQLPTRSRSSTEIFQLSIFLLRLLGGTKIILSPVSFLFQERQAFKFNQLTKIELIAQSNMSGEITVVTVYADGVTAARKKRGGCCVLWNRRTTCERTLLLTLLLMMLAYLLLILADRHWRLLGDTPGWG